MSRLTYVSDEFACNLQCGQCNHKKPDGQRCRNRTCFGFPKCWIHNKKQYTIKTKLSPVHGTGLFATDDIGKGEWICPYSGEKISRRCLDRRYPGDVTATYAIQNGRSYIDSACRRGIGSMANGKFTAAGVSLALRYHNAKFEKHRGGVWLRATKDIRGGREIFVWYGDDYRLDDDADYTKRTRLYDNRPC